MLRKVLGVGVGMLVLLGTICVLWAGLNWPPPVWILKYGGPHSQHPTGKTLTVEDVTFVMISPGYFRMGSDWLTAHPKEDWWHRGDTRGDLIGRVAEGVGLSWGRTPKPSSEMPLHWVQFAHGFGIARTEVTNAEYERFDPQHKRGRGAEGDQDPVTEVSWADARKYCAWLSKKSGLKIGLPSESEWECACRAGTQTEYASGADERGLREFAWYEKNSRNLVHEVRTQKANAWGLFDMEGNVDEWCEDLSHSRYLVGWEMKGKDHLIATETVDRAPDDGSAWETWETPTQCRLLRGGCFNDPAARVRSTFRCRWSPPTFRYPSIGFRPALSSR